MSLGVRCDDDVCGRASEDSSCTEGDNTKQPEWAGHPFRLGQGHKNPAAFHQWCKGIEQWLIKTTSETRAGLESFSMLQFKTCLGLQTGDNDLWAVFKRSNGFCHQSGDFGMLHILRVACIHITWIEQTQARQISVLLHQFSKPCAQNLLQSLPQKFQLLRRQEYSRKMRSSWMDQ